ncbi:uncharacterized protein [Epargyreus clarus]|uniref:uncharacterized protein n=1 Tax=Epargyreus clarus TaxID=520877 RepID=UPI003C2E25AF
MFSAKFPLFLLISVYFAWADIIEKTSDNYGPYTVEWEQYYSCRGPKLTNLTEYTTTLVKESNFYNGAINITFPNDTKVEDVKMCVYSIKGNRKTLLYNNMINKPCQHYLMSKVFESYVGAQNCLIKKGTYITELNFTEIIQKHLGTSFFYGEFVFKVLVLSKKGNIICLMFNPIFKKKV